MKLIELTKGHAAIVDDDDYEGLSIFRWCVANKNGKLYAVRGRRKSDGPGTVHISMHREIFGHPAGQDIDHINGNGLDNRRENLRACSHADNQKSNSKRIAYGGRPTASKFKGVHWHNKNKKWCAKLANKYIGSFASEEDAALAYDSAACSTYGEFAKTNFGKNIQLKEKGLIK